MVAFLEYNLGFKSVARVSCRFALRLEFTFRMPVLGFWLDLKRTGGRRAASIATTVANTDRKLYDLRKLVSSQTQASPSLLEASITTAGGGRRGRQLEGVLH
nr:hypothetical protein Iba_scaffold61485CG0030 [Ipomoea batatas]